MSKKYVGLFSKSVQNSSTSNSALRTTYTARFLDEQELLALKSPQEETPPLLVVAASEKLIQAYEIGKVPESDFEHDVNGILDWALKLIADAGRIANENAETNAKREPELSLK